MIAKKITVFLITIFFICLYMFFLFFFQIPEMIKAQNNEAKIIVKNVYSFIKEKNNKSSTLFNLPKKSFFAIWIKNDHQNWIPIIYDRKILSINSLQYPDKIPKSISITTRIFEGKLNDYRFIFWLNKFNIKFITKHIVLSLLFLILIYLILLLLVEIFFRENTVIVENDQFINDTVNSYEAPTEKKEELFIDKNKTEENLNEYKKLWNKNFQISDNFKNNFPFKKIFDLIKIGINPEEYIMDSIDIATKFFKWENPKFYLSQKNYFIDINTKNALEEANVIIPVNGKQKGPVFIPLFPYDIANIYGYFSFEWNSNNDFYISDILFFLKYIFSEKAKFIFLNKNLIQNLTDYLKEKFEKQTGIYSTIIEVDNKDKLILESKNEFIEKLNDSIKDNLSNSFFKEKIFQISQLSYILIGDTNDEKEKAKEIDTWMRDIENQYYNISTEAENIAVTFSAGISFKNNRDLHPLTLLNESENYLKKAIHKGGNILISD